MLYSSISFFMKIVKMNGILITKYPWYFRGIVVGAERNITSKNIHDRNVMSM